MRNDELFSPNCPDPHANRLVRAYVLRGLLDDRGTYWPQKLPERQYAVYEAWLEEVRKHTTSFSCDFYEWLCRDCDSAFVFAPGELVKHGDRYCVVTRRCPGGISWANSWRMRNGVPKQEPWPAQLNTIELKYPDGRRTCIVNALDKGMNIEPADIPPEVFALACEKAKNCPMMRGGAE